MQKHLCVDLDIFANKTNLSFNFSTNILNCSPSQKSPCFQVSCLDPNCGPSCWAHCEVSLDVICEEGGTHHAHLMGDHER